MPTITSAEYFIGTDPGLGQGIAIEGSFDSTLEDISFNIDPETLGVGAHTVYVRFQDDQGTWGEVEKQQTLKQGERIGMIRFGSRVDIYFKNKKLLAKLGQNVIAGESIIAS